MDYEIIQAASAYSLEQQVKGLLLKGWVPLGGIVITRVAGALGGGEFLYSQAMTKGVRLAGDRFIIDTQEG